MPSGQNGITAIQNGLQLCYSAPQATIKNYIYLH